MNIKPAASLLVASTFSAIALFCAVPVRAEDEASQKADAGKKDAKECHEGSGCGNGVCPWAADKQGADKKQQPQQEGEAAQPAAPATPPSSSDQ